MGAFELQIKFHPREALPNITALNRANTLYVELRGDARKILGQAIHNFQGALEGQDPKVIEEARGALNNLLEHMIRE